MCGRISLHSDPERYADAFGARMASELVNAWHPRWNVAPSSPIAGVREQDGGRELRMFRWGLLPGWAKDPSISNRTFNARAETVATKPIFRSAFRRRRLIVAADGFYEWQFLPGTKSKQPHYFHRADGAPLALAGLWESRRSGEEEQLSATIITTAAGPDMAPIHERQPVLLEPDALDRWLDPAIDGQSELQEMLRSGVGQLVHHPVHRDVGNVRNDNGSLIEELDRDCAGAGNRGGAGGGGGSGGGGSGSGGSGGGGSGSVVVAVLQSEIRVTTASLGVSMKLHP